MQRYYSVIYVFYSWYLFERRSEELTMARNIYCNDVGIFCAVDCSDDQEFSLTRFCDITTRVASLSSPYNLDVILEMFDEITKLFSVITC